MTISIRCDTIPDVWECPRNCIPFQSPEETIKVSLENIYKKEKRTLNYLLTFHDTGTASLNITHQVNNPGLH